jgi:uncharacterized ubiquitin-like protein YukD
MSQAESIPLRVQVIDMQSVTLDIVVPTYLPARDLTQRVARDAGLNAFWPDGRRRRYWIRARGRVVGDDERLADVGVIAGELVHLLPEPAGPEVVEQPPAYPETRDYPAGGNLALIGSVTSVLAWSVGWGVALSASDNLAVLLLPGVGLGLLACSLARHIFAGSGVRWTIAAVGVVVTLILLAPAAMIPYVSGLPLEQALNQLVPGAAGGLHRLAGVVGAGGGAAHPGRERAGSHRPRRHRDALRHLRPERPDGPADGLPVPVRALLPPGLLPGPGGAGPRRPLQVQHLRRAGPLRQPVQPAAASSRARAWSSTP